MYKISVKALLALLFISFSLLTDAQTIPGWGWAKTHTGNKEDRCVDIAADSRNGVYSYGYFKSDTLYLGSQYLLGTGGTDIFLVKYDTLGNLQWAKSFGGGLTNINTPANITTDKSGHIVITGSFTGTINFGGTILTSTGGTDVYVVRIRPNGNIAWAKQFTGTLDDSGGPVACDDQSNIYTAGNFKSSPLSIGATALAPSGTIKVFYCGIDSSGNNLWAQTTSSSANFSIYDMEVLASSNIIMGGNIESGGNVSFAPGGAGSFFSIYHNIFTVKISAAGNFINQNVTGGIGNRFFSGGMAINKQQRILEAGFATFLSTNPPIAQVVLSDSNYNRISGAAASRLTPAGPTTCYDVIADIQNRVIVLANNIGNNTFGPGLNLNTSDGVSLVWELDSVLNPKAILALTVQPGFSGYLRRVAKDTVSNTLYLAGYIDAFTPGGTYTIGSNVLPHGTGQDGAITQLRRVYSGPPLQVFAGNDTVVCNGKSAVIGTTNGAAGGIAPYTYSWLPVTGLANPAAASTTASPAGSTVYTLKVTDAVGSIANDAVLVNVKPVPLAPSITISSSTNICLGDTTTLVCSLPGSGSYYYDWYRGGIFVQRIFDNTNFRVGTPGHYTVSVSDDVVLCASPQSAAVTVTGTISSISAGGPTAFCQGDSVILTASGGGTYLWSTGATTSSITVKTGGSYTVQATAGSCAGAVSAPVTITINARPNMGADTIVYQNCYAETTNLLPLYNTAGFTAVWNTATPSAAPPGIYRLIVTNSTNCADTAFATIKLEVATWTGAISSDWHTAGNWNINKVPTAVTHVIISNGTPNNCVISTANGIAASLQLRNGAVLTTSNGMQVVITGNCSVLPP